MKSLKGQLLVASPALLDPNFFRTVVLLIQHSEEGALGLVLNRPLETTVEEAWDQVSQEQCRVDDVIHQGGPCEGPLMAVHADGQYPEMEVMPGIYFTTERDAIEHLVETAENPARFFVGYSGWGPGQLESELSEGGWLVAPANFKQIFADSEDLWETVTREITGQAAWLNLNPKVIPEDPSMN